jgi:amino acid adenylation domain-containing protein
MHEQGAKCSASGPELLSTDLGQDAPAIRNENIQIYSENAFVPELVAARAIATPEAIAVAADGEKLTYRDLEARASQLAHHLKSLGAGPERLVVLCMERSLGLVVGALGVLKTGAAYVPLDPSWPADRLLFMLRDSGTDLVITQQNVAARLPQGKWRTVHLDLDVKQIAGHPVSFTPAAVKSEDLAYVIYTSGSTGQPKGVQITHGGLLNLVDWHLGAFSIRATDRATLFASPGFDASVWEIWPYLCAGASIYVAYDSLRTDAEKLRDWLVTQGITITFVPTVLAELMMTLPWPAHIPLQTVLTGADTLHRFPPAGLPFKLVNNYGPTECTVVTTSGSIPAGGNGTEQPTIGRPISNVQIFVVDEHLKQVPAGTAGELLVGGKGLARGYLNQPALTAEKFIANSFGTAPGSRLYRTGDLVRILPDGQIAFLGRTDNQIKIRGYRIEPGEIVATLDRYPSVLASHVIAHGDGMAEKKLVAYLVPAAGSRPDYSDLRSFLLKNLPEYMVPAVFVVLDSLPQTSNGKVDRAALPAPTEANTLRSAPSAPVQSPVESQVATIVATLLGLQQVGADDNFFLLGGHSLLATQVISRVRDSFDVDISLRMLFEAPTVAQLSAEIERLLVEKLENMSEEEAQRKLNVLAPSN